MDDWVYALGLAASNIIEIGHVLPVSFKEQFWRDSGSLKVVQVLLKTRVKAFERGLQSFAILFTLFPFDRLARNHLGDQPRSQGI